MRWCFVLHEAGNPASTSDGENLACPSDDVTFDVNINGTNTAPKFTCLFPKLVTSTLKILLCPTWAQGPLVPFTALHGYARNKKRHVCAKYAGVFSHVVNKTVSQTSPSRSLIVHDKMITSCDIVRRHIKEPKLRGYITKQ